MKYTDGGKVNRGRAKAINTWCDKFITGVIIGDCDKIDSVVLALSIGSIDNVGQLYGGLFDIFEQINLSEISITNGNDVFWFKTIEDLYNEDPDIKFIFYDFDDEREVFVGGCIFNHIEEIKKEGMIKYLLGLH